MTLKDSVLFLLTLWNISKKWKIGTILKLKMDQIHLGKEESDSNYGGFIPKLNYLKIESNKLKTMS